MARDRAVAGLAWRQSRRGGLIVIASLAVLIAAFGAVFNTLEPTLTNANGANDLFTSPTLLALYGPADAIDTRGGFIIWRGSLMLPVLAALWAAVTSTRVLRGDEDAGRWDLLLTAPLRRVRSVGVNLGVLTALCVLMTVVTTITFIAGGSETTGSILYGVGLGALGLTFVGVGACASQVFGNRRLAAGVSGAVLGGTMVLRVAANSSHSRAWMRWLSPFGWLEAVKAFDTNEVGPVLLLVATAVVLLVVSVALVGRRDVGDGLVRTSSHARSHERLLTGPLGFAWRQNLVGLIGWCAGMAFYGLVIGAVAASGAEFIAENPDVEQLMDDFGMSGLSTPEGFVASLAGFVAVAFAIYAASSLGRCYEDESDGRLDVPYAGPLSRWRWLGSQVLAGTIAVAAAVVVSIASTWIGALVGNADLSFNDVAIGTLNTLPATALFFGLGVLLFGFRPSLSVAVSVGAAVGVYVLSFLGPLLDWPTWVQDLNPFQRLGNAPVTPVAWEAIAIILAIAAIEISVGFLGYQRRDLE